MVNFSKFFDFFRISINGISKRKTRSWLTMIGIFIGIAAVVALISLGEGLGQYVQEEFQKLGSDKVIVSPGGSILGMGGSESLFDEDVDLISKLKSVERVIGYVYSSAKVEWKDEIYFPLIMGVSTEKESFELFLESGLSIKEGRVLKSGEKYKAIVGYDYLSHDSFSDHLKVGDKIDIGGFNFEVVGVWNKVGNSNDDRSITIPIETARDVLNIPHRIDSILVQVKPDQLPSVVAEKIDSTMRKDRGLKEGEEDYEVQTMEDVLKSFLSILNIVKIVLAGIASISLLVGGIGIMNTMYTAVLERTKEIGIMKAIGARNGDITTLFLIESGLLGMVGGIIGILLGVGLGYIASFVAQISGFEQLKAHFPLYLILGALAFSFFVGMVSGVFPARSAAKKNPVDALRYE